MSTIPNLSKVLFTKTQQQVLGLLYGQAEAEFYTNELIRLTQCGTGAVTRELAKLNAAGLINVRQIGNQKHYQANQACPFFQELRSIILKTFGLADILKDALKPQAKEIEIAFVYGSIAKQQDHASSDIDLMIISNTLSYGQLFQALMPAEEKLRRKINPTFYSKKEWVEKRNQGSNFVTQIINLPKIYLIGSVDELDKLG